MACECEFRVHGFQGQGGREEIGSIWIDGHAARLAAAGVRDGKIELVPRGGFQAYGSAARRFSQHHQRIRSHLVERPEQAGRAAHRIHGQNASIDAGLGLLESRECERRCVLGPAIEGAEGGDEDFHGAPKLTCMGIISSQGCRVPGCRRVLSA